tara:strand:+ start:19 stop:615 length:597 start_codon:yes stop_codon:yes gene_type:complete
MNKYIFIKIIFLSLSIIYSSEITDEQLDKIKEVTNDINIAKNFSLKSVIKDSTYTLSNMKDKVILINFWATWCGPCRMEIPDFNELYKKYSDKGLEILGISISDTKEQLVNFLKAYTIDYPVLYGSQGDMQKVIIDYGGVYSIPMSFLIGKNNEIKRIYPGAILKQYDPNMYSDLIYTIETSLAEEYKVENILTVPDE